MVRDVSLRNTQHFKIGLKGKEGVWPFPTTRCISNWKGSLSGLSWLWSPTLLATYYVALPYIVVICVPFTDEI